MNADLSEAVQRLVYFLGNYEPGVSRVITQTLKPGDIFIDIGAHVGYFTLLASTCVGPEGKIFSFEPQPQVFLDLEQNVKLNRLNNVRIIRSAIFDVNQDLEIFLPVEGNTGTASLLRRPDTPGTSFNCTATTLDSFLERESIDQIKLIKIDIEGAEPFALKGMSKLLSSDSPPDIICEAVPFLLEISCHKPRDLVDFLDAFGYTGRLITNDGLVDFDPDRHQSPTADCNLYSLHSRTLE